jgi:arginyl-tRNA synthetase
MIDVLGADHKLISGQLAMALALLDILRPEVVIFEFVSLPGESMSTRRGVFVSVDELLDEVEAHAFVEVEKRRGDIGEPEKRRIAKSVATGSIRYDIIRVSHEKPTTFDWRDALDFEKRGGPFIQYAYARACSILRKSTPFQDFDPDLLMENQEVDLIKRISTFPSIIERVANELNPHFLATYARELAEAFNQFYRDVPVLGADERTRKARLALVDCFRIVLRETLGILGIEALESM